MTPITISLILNILVFVLVSAGTIMMFTGFTFSKDDSKLSAANINALKFFTVESNILAGIAAFTLAIFQILLITKKIDNIPLYIIDIKYFSTVAVALTFFITAFFLAPTASEGFLALYKDNNLLFHFLVPVLCMTGFILVDGNLSFIHKKFLFSLTGILPVLLYAIYYTLNVLIHKNKGEDYKEYDWYGFLRKGFSTIYIVLPLILFVSYILNIALLYSNIHWGF